MNPSSDLPTFSSDDLSASLEDYSSQKRKRQHTRRWWDDRRTSLSTEAGFTPVKRKRSPFTRNDDSGVWMNSDDAEPEMDEAPDGRTSALHNRAMPTCSQETDDLSMVGSNSESVIPPYWQHQPESLVDFYATQARASRIIQTALDFAEENVDLSYVARRGTAPTIGCFAYTTHRSQNLDIILSSTLRPLHLLIRVLAERIVPLDVRYNSLVPRLGLFLRNNTLRALPGEIYKLSNLRTLSVQQNRVQELSPSIANLVHLRELNLSVNHLRYLPYEILKLCKGRLTGLRIRSNPFSEPLPRNWKANAQILSDQMFMNWLHSNGPSLRARSTTAYFDAFGKVCRASCPAPSKAEEYLCPPEIPWNPLDLSIYTSCRAPSLAELCLRACQGSAFLGDFAASPSNEDGIPDSIVPLLQEAWTTQDAGQKLCSVCKKPYIIARTEWLEWWSHFLTHETLARPFIRRGCSWACVPDPEVPPEGWRNCGWGFSRPVEKDISGLTQALGRSNDSVRTNIPVVWPAVAREMRLIREAQAEDVN